MARDITKKVVDVALFVASQYVLDSLNNRESRSTTAAKQKGSRIMERLGKADLTLSHYEEIISAEVILPDDINIRFADIGGLDSIVSSLRESVIYPLCYPELFAGKSNLIAAPKGVLLYGPPGCGKTMLAKALAKESGATFINITASVIQDKWFGESNKLVSGLFSLARKLQPCIIFIDEIDSFLRERNRGDHEVTAMMKAEFMTLWDGLASGDATRILVLGATNRPTDIDAAILRRMPKRFAVKLPDLKQRERILQLMLASTSLAPDLSIEMLAKQTDGLSGSDLKEVCRNAAIMPVREYMRDKGGDPEEMMKAQKEYHAHLQKTVIDAARFATRLPPKTDLAFHRTLDRKFAKELDKCSNRILGLTNQLLGLVGALNPALSKGKGKARALADENDLVEGYSAGVVDVLDVLYENIDSCLDEYSGKKAKAQASAASNDPPNSKLSKKDKKDASKPLGRDLLYAANILKPQLKFVSPPDNSKPWRQSLKTKPHSLRPLNPKDVHPYQFEIQHLEYGSQISELNTPRPPRTFEDTPFTWVDTSEGVHSLLTKLKAATEIAVDLEHHDYRTYAGLVCLMQISTREEDFVVDTLAVRNELEILNEVFTDPAITKVFHGADRDIQWLQRDFNLYIVNMFDTYHAAMELGFPKRSLAYLLAEYCNFEADKRYQLADWRIRPLPEEMLFYARSDTHFLLFVYDSLRNALLKRSPQSIHNVLRHSASTAQNVYESEDTSLDAAHHLMRKWNKGLWGKQLAVFEAIFQWRDRIARQEDESIKYVLPNQFLFTLSERPPTDVAKLISTVQPTPPPVRRRADELLEVIKGAISAHTLAQKQKVEEQHAREALGAMDVDSGPFANVAPEGDDDETSSPNDIAVLDTSSLFGETLSAQKKPAIVASHSTLFGDTLTSSKVASVAIPNYEEIINRIHSKLVLTPSVPAALKAAAVLRIKEAEASQPKPAADLPVPTEPEQIPFVPAAERQSGATLVYRPKIQYNGVDMGEDEGEEIEDVRGSVQRKKVKVAKASKTKRVVLEKGETAPLLAGLATTTEYIQVSKKKRDKSKAKDEQSDEDDVEEPVQSNGSQGETDQRKSNGKKRQREKSGQPATPREDTKETKAPYDYSTAPNLLDEGLEDIQAHRHGQSDRAKRRKLEKEKANQQKRTQKSAGISSSFGPAPKAYTQPKSGNRSMTFKS
ncbi:exosome nuclease subunit [Tulasnella sp. 403]|nr:exosome nuclease subunit [Tulasnella sp. 403]